MGINKDNWKEFFFETNEGLGTLYDRVILEKFFDKFIQDYNIKSVLDCPSFGMTGFSGINSIYLAKKGILVTVCDNDSERLNWTKKLWEDIGLDANFILVDNFSKLPFENQNFDLVWNLSALWYLKENDLSLLIYELGRVTKKCMFISIHNKKQLFYSLWKKMEPDFVQYVKEEYSDETLVLKTIKDNCLDFDIKDEGYFVTTPWPGIILKKDQIFGKKDENGKRNNDYIISKNLDLNLNLKDIKLPEYISHLNDPKLNDRIKKLMLLENLPEFIKKYWAHLKYWTFIRKPTNYTDR